MEFIVMGVLGLLSVGSLICWIMTLIAMFQNPKQGGVVKGIFGVLCPLWAFIWGWMTAGELSRGQIMKIWTALFIVSLIMQFAVGGMAIGSQ